MRVEDVRFLLIDAAKHELDAIVTEQVFHSADFPIVLIAREEDDPIGMGIADGLPQPLLCGGKFGPRFKFGVLIEKELVTPDDESQLCGLLQPNQGLFATAGSQRRYGKQITVAASIVLNFFPKFDCPLSCCSVSPRRCGLNTVGLAGLVCVSSFSHLTARATPMSIMRWGQFPIEFLTSGPAYATLKFLIRCPQPLDPEWTWDFITQERPPFQVWMRNNYPPRFIRRLFHGHHFRKDHSEGIEEHYDVSNDFYELFLDKKYMFYTCADWRPDTTTIEQAQTNKANHIISLLEPKAGERILELGCGWGSMMKRVCEETGDKENLVGYTISKEQVRYNQEVNGFNVEYRNFITTEYPEAAYDKIYSIGAWEAVRPEDHAQLMAKLYKTLRPGGRAVIHFFCFNSDVRPASSLSGLIYFPGHVLSSYRFYVDEFEQAGFYISSRTVHDYRQTLRAWFDRLVENKEQALDLVGVETYNRYITFFPASWRYFQDGTGMLIRWVLEKPSAEGAPATRSESQQVAVS
ncbi:MAG: class I SAM-dependent methyltransferase [Planctomycetota bacterium]